MFNAPAYAAPWTTRRNHDVEAACNPCPLWVQLQLHVRRGRDLHAVAVSFARMRRFRSPSRNLNMGFAAAIGFVGERPAQVLISAALVAMGAVAWSSLPAHHESLMPLVCRSDGSSKGSIWEALGVFWAAGDLTGVVGSWLSMTMAMAPFLVHQALRTVTTGARSASAVWLSCTFLASYLSVWVGAIPLLTVFSATMEWIGLSHGVSSAWLTGATAIVWQLGPIKRHALNLCHRQPIRTADGAIGTMTCAQFGMLSALGCAGSCWALMLTAMALPGDMRLSMLAVLIAVAVERHVHRPCPQCHVHPSSIKRGNVSAVL